MLSEAPGPVNFTQMVMLFAEKMAGGADDDDTILKAFDAFEVNGKIEVDNAFGEFSIEDGMIDAVQLKGLMVSKKEEGEEAERLRLEEEAKQKAEEEAAEKLRLEQEE